MSPPPLRIKLSTRSCHDMPSAKNSEVASTYRSICDFFKPSQTIHYDTRSSRRAPCDNGLKSSRPDSPTQNADGVRPLGRSTPRRGPGQPRNTPTSQVQDQQDDDAVSIRHLARPSETISSPRSVTVEQSTPFKRGPGRPSKTPLNRSPGRPGKTPLNRRPGRPCETPLNRGPGRSRKTPLNHSSGRPRITSLSTIHSSRSESDTNTKMRDPGRPRRTVVANQLYNSPSSHRGSATLETCHDPPAKAYVVISLSSQEMLCGEPLGESNSDRSTSSASSSIRFSEKPTSSPTQTKMYPPPRPTATMQRAQTNVLLSSSLMSTLTSVPTSTQSSSKRFIQNGIKGVTNSDSESDDASSDDQLPDIWAFLSPKPAEAARKIEEPWNTVVAKQTRSTTRLVERTSTKRRSPVLSESPAPTRCKFDFARMAEQARQRDAVDAKIAEMEKEAEEEDEDAQSSGDERQLLAKAAMGSDGEERRRMIQALERTEVLQRTEEYYFFVDDGPLLQDEPFPVDSLSDEPWSQTLREASSRTQAFLTGFVAEMAAVSPLSVNVTNWLAGQLLYERRETLCAAYVEVLRVSATHPGSLSDTLAMLNCFYKTRSFGEERRKDTGPPDPPYGLADVMRMVSFCAPAADKGRDVPSLTSAAFLDLALLAIDEHIRKDMSMSMTVAQCIETLLDAISEEAFGQVITEVSAALFHSNELTSLIQCRLIIALPTATPRVFRLRRCLALECIAAGPDKLQNVNLLSEWPASLLRALCERTEFCITGATNYRLLGALVSVLDIAVGAGFTSYEELHSAESAKPVGPFGRLAGPSATEKMHDQQVDALTAQLRDVASRIRGSGTTQLARTEAKSAIERLIVRLEHNVRTRPKQKKNIFAGGSSASLDNFVVVREKEGPWV